MVSVPPSLADPAFGPLWAAVRARLERTGTVAGSGPARGRVATPTLPAPARAALAAVLDRPVGAGVDLAVLEAGLARLGIGPDLPSALATLGEPVSGEAAARRAERTRQRDGRDAARATVASTWPESWAADWIDSVIRAGVLRGLDAEAARRFVAQVRQVFDHLAAAGAAFEGRDSGGVSRVEVAARLLGDAHALDTGSRLEVAVGRALAAQQAAKPVASGPVDPWDAAGVQRDLVSAPVLTWNLPVNDACGLAPLIRSAGELGVPLHLSKLALTAHPVQVPAGAEVLVCVNPRVVEAAAQRRVAGAVVTTNGNPSTTAVLLLAQLAATGATLRYHGDFDAAGLRICARMARLGAVPWRMAAADYAEAVAAAERDRVVLPFDPDRAPPTPWDPGLQAAFDACRQIVHEERLLDVLLGGTSGG